MWLWKSDLFIHIKQRNLKSKYTDTKNALWRPNDVLRSMTVHQNKSYPILSYHILSFPLLSSPLLSSPLLSFPFLSFPFLSFPFLSFPFLSFPFHKQRCYPLSRFSSFTVRNAQWWDTMNGSRSQEVTVSVKNMRSTCSKKLNSLFNESVKRKP